MASCQKLGIILVINGFKNWFYQKMSITTNVLLNWYSSMKKKIQKDSDDFWHRKLTLKVKFWYFLTAPHYSNFQNLVISFEYSWFLAKNLSNFVSLPWKLHNRECHNPHKIDPPRPIVPIKFGPHGQMVPKSLVPLDKWSLTNLVPIFPDPHSMFPWTIRIF